MLFVKYIHNMTTQKHLPLRFCDGKNEALQDCRSARAARIAYVTVTPPYLGARSAGRSKQTAAFKIKN